MNVRERLLALAALAALAVIAGCAPGAVRPLAAPPSTASAQSTTTAPDLNGVMLPGVPGRTTIPGVVIGPGHANLSGVVTGPTGAVGGATVEIQRLVGDAAATARVAAGPDGRWSLPGVLGGRYRIRAWRSPDQTLVTPTIFFLGGSENHTVDLTLQAFTGTVATSAIAPNPPAVDQPANLVVNVSNRSVDATGVGRSEPIAGASVQLTGTGSWRLTTPNPATTDGGGQATWQLTCQSAGTQPIGVSVNGGPAQSLDVPACV